MPSAIEPSLEKIVDYLQNRAAKASQNFQVGKGIPWNDFSELKLVGNFDFPGLNDLFDRSKSADSYIVARVQNLNAKVFDASVPKVSSDWVAAMSRDYRMRRRSRIRNFVMAANRHAVDSDGRGPLRRNTVDWLTRLMQQTVEPPKPGLNPKQ